MNVLNQLQPMAKQQGASWTIPIAGESNNDNHIHQQQQVLVGNTVDTLLHEYIYGLLHL